MPETDLCRNAQIGFLITWVREMKRFFSFVLCFCFIVGLTSCEEDINILETEKIIAVKYGSSAEAACEEYVYDGYTKITYNSSSDVVLAVENKKADCGVLDAFELNSYINSGRNIEEQRMCEYCIDYCAYFNIDNQKLQDEFNQAIKELSENGTFDKINKAHLKGESYFNNNSHNENGTLTMLCDPSFENRVYTDDDGEIVGLDVDSAREICNYLGYDLQIVTADFDELFIKLDNNEGDFIISACEFMEERTEYYLASDIYFTLNFYLVERV